MTGRRDWPATAERAAVVCDRCGQSYILTGAALYAFESAALAALGDPDDEGHVCGICREVEFTTGEEVP